MTNKFIKYVQMYNRCIIEFVLVMLCICPALINSELGRNKIEIPCSITDGCNCYIENTEVVYKCPADSKEEIRLIVTYDNELVISCPLQTKLSQLERIPKMNIGVIDSVYFNNCPTPVDGPTYQSIFTHLGLSHITSMYIQYFDQSQLLAVNMFADLQNLTELYIQYASIPIYDQLFKDLYYLEILYLNNNNMSVLTSKMFQSQYKLETLYILGRNSHDLDFNSKDLETLEAGVFDNMPKLKKLFLRSNSIRSLPEGLLEHTQEICTFILTDNHVAMETLPSRFFASLPMLKTVEIECGLTSIPKDLFTDSVELETIRLSKNNLKFLPERVFDNLTRLLELDLNHNQLKNLEKGVFNSLKSVNKLDLSNNQLKNISPALLVNMLYLDLVNFGNNKILVLSPEIFRNQNKMRALNLHGNNIKTVQKNQLDGLTLLQELDLSSNELETLESGVFDNMTKLTLLHLSSNPITFLPEGLLENTQIRNFKLVENRVAMERLPSQIFGYKRLQILNTVEIECGLTSLPDNIFSDITVYNMTLSKNNLNNLSVSVFDGLTNLEYLDLSRNQLIELEDGVFKSLISVIKLDLSQNRIIHIGETLLYNMTNLVKLYLNGNQLHTIDFNAFYNTKNLRYLNLADNKLNFGSMETKYIHYVDNNYWPLILTTYLKNLNTLDLRNNSLTSISIVYDWCLHNNQTINFDLSYNNISKIDVAKIYPYYPSESTITLNLTHNSLEFLDFKNVDMLLKNAKKKIKCDIYIDHNDINCDCNILPFVRFLNTSTQILDANKLKVFAGELKCFKPAALKGRRIIDVKPNDLLCNIENSSCPASCQCQERTADFTMIVNCSHSGLTYVPKLSMPSKFGLNFTILHIDNNRITSLPLLDKENNATFGYEFVTEIHADHNNINEIHANSIPGNLQKLSVRNNKLRILNETTMNRINSRNNLKSMSLGHNPWTCDCNAQYLLQFIHNNIQTKLLTDIADIECSGNGNKFKLLHKHNLADICPKINENNFAFVMMNIIMVLFGLSGILVALYYKYQQELKVWMYAHKMLSCLVTEQEIDCDKKYDAFVSYSHKDYMFVSECIVQELEKAHNPYRLCLHERDWMVGNAITESIAESVESSRRTIIVLTKNFVDSDWGKMEFQVAHKKALRENQARVIVIVCDELQDLNIDAWDAEMKAYLQTNTYIKWGEPWFWKRLRYAMPHRMNTHTNDKQDHIPLANA